MLKLRTAVIGLVGLALAFMAPISPAEARIAPTVSYTVGCGRVDFVSTSSYRIAVYYGGSNVADSYDSADGALVLDPAASGVVATTRSTLYYYVSSLDRSIETPKTITVPQNCTGARKGSVVITGRRAVGLPLTASTGTWVPTPLSFSYQWYRNGVAISGATAKSYTPVAADRGKHLRVKVVASFVGYKKLTRESKRTMAIRTGVLVTVKPTISRSGDTLTATAGTWTPAPVTLTYQWFLSGKKIKGATASTLAVPSDSLNKKVTVRVCGTKAGFHKACRTSAAFVIAALG